MESDYIDFRSLAYLLFQTKLFFSDNLISVSFEFDASFDTVLSQILFCWSNEEK